MTKQTKSVGQIMSGRLRELYTTWTSGRHEKSMEEKRNLED